MDHVLDKATDSSDSPRDLVCAKTIGCSANLVDQKVLALADAVLLELLLSLEGRLVLAYLLKSELGKLLPLFLVIISFVMLIAQSI